MQGGVVLKVQVIMQGASYFDTLDTKPLWGHVVQKLGKRNGRLEMAGRRMLADGTR